MAWARIRSREHYSSRPSSRSLFSAQAHSQHEHSKSRKAAFRRASGFLLLCVGLHNVGVYYDICDSVDGMRRSLSIAGFGATSEGEIKTLELSLNEAGMLSEIGLTVPLGSGLGVTPKKRTTSLTFEPKIKQLQVQSPRKLRSAKGDDDGREERHLSLYFGPGQCEWTAGEPITTPVESTFLVGFPGSGKRLAWQLMEALTGAVAGDDWNLSEQGYNVAFMKGTFPHHESNLWLWGSQMDQTILMVRNPRDAIRSYRDVRYELYYAPTWWTSYLRRDSTFTMQEPISNFEVWKDAGCRSFNQENYVGTVGCSADLEIRLWSWYIDWWMEGGLRRNLRHDVELHQVFDYQRFDGYDYDNIVAYDITPSSFDVTYDANGTVISNVTLNETSTPVYAEMYTDIYRNEPKYAYNDPAQYYKKCAGGTDPALECRPVAVVSYEALANPATGPTEMAVLANALSSQEGVTMIPSDAWDCIYTQTMIKTGEADTKGMNYRMASGALDKPYDDIEIELMKKEITYIRDKYSQSSWTSGPMAAVASKLVGIMDTYLAESFFSSHSYSGEMPLDDLRFPDGQFDGTLSLSYLLSGETNVTAGVTWGYENHPSRLNKPTATPYP